MSFFPIALRTAVAAILAAGLATAQVTQLSIRVLAGEGLVHAAGARASFPVAIEVVDEGGAPVDGATVSFLLPEDGPGGIFSNGLKTEVTLTDAAGRASFRALSVNRVTGEFEIRVTAAKGTARAGTVIRQYVSDRMAKKGMEKPSVARKTLPAPAAGSPPPAKPEPEMAAGIPAPVKAEPAPVAASGSPSPAPVASSPAPAPAASAPASAPVAPAPAPKPRVVSVPAPKKKNGWVWVALLAAGAAGGAIAATQRGGTSPGASASPGAPPAPPVIGAPTITVGRP